MIVTPLFIAVFAVGHLIATMRVGLYRNEKDIRYGDGGDEGLMRRIRAHGNFAETVPMALIAMAAAEYVGAAPVLIALGGLALLIGRLLHYFMTIGSGWGNMRAVSMALTFVPYVLFPILIIASQLYAS